jgi:hypothetical protein
MSYLLSSKLANPVRGEGERYVACLVGVNPDLQVTLCVDTRCEVRVCEDRRTAFDGPLCASVAG